MCGWDWGRSLREGVQSPRLEERRSLCCTEAGAGADQRGGDAAVHHPRGGSSEAPGDLRAPQRGQVRKWGGCPGQQGPGFRPWTGRARVWVHKWTGWKFGFVDEVSTKLCTWSAVWGFSRPWCCLPELTSALCVASHTHTNTHLQRHRCVTEVFEWMGKEPYIHCFLRRKGEWKKPQRLPGFVSGISSASCSWFLAAFCIVKMAKNMRAEVECAFHLFKCFYREL